MARTFAYAAVALAGILGAGSASAQVNALDVRSFTANSGRGFDAQQGFSTLTQPITLNCGNYSGCIVSIEAMVEPEDATPFSVCTLVDGVQALPVCRQNGQNQFPSSRQHAVVSGGLHTYTTQIFLAGPTTLHIGNWEVDYTIYARP